MNLLKTLCVPVVVVALSASAAVADGKGRGDKGHGKKPKHHAAQTCPPGLAKKSPACVPPGQAKKALPVHKADRAPQHEGRPYRLGDIARADCLSISRSRYPQLAPGTYCRAEDRLLRIDPETRAVLTILNLLSN